MSTSSGKENSRTYPSLNILFISIRKGSHPQVSVDFDIDYLQFRMELPFVDIDEFVQKSIFAKGGLLS
jgi:hypothetical protein